MLNVKQRPSLVLLTRPAIFAALMGPLTDSLSQRSIHGLGQALVSSFLAFNCRLEMY